MKIAYRICFLGGLSFGLVAVDALPRYEQGQLTINLNGNQVLAQSIEELQKYGDAAQEIERLRRTTYSNIQNMVGESKSPPLACHQQQNFSQLPDAARKMAIDYCEQSEGIVRKYGLTIGEFNHITQQIKKNPALKEKLQEMMSK